jgi:SAM-dependent methyltransferase
MSAVIRYLSVARQRIRAAADFRSQFRRFEGANDGRFPVRWQERFPCLPGDHRNATPPKDYLLHVGWAARKVAEENPAAHVDFSSLAYFAVVLSAFVPVRYCEFRPAGLGLDGLDITHSDLCGLDFSSNSLGSVSCMHVVEHVGLGRYGDPIDPTGDIKAMRELQRVCAPGGRLYFVVPVGRPRVQFNAHRIYGFDQVVDGFPEMELLSHGLVTDKGRELISNAPASLFDQQSYGCGCFEFTKRST